MAETPPINGGWSSLVRRWHILAALAGFLLACGKVVFSAGGVTSVWEEKVLQIEKHVDASDQIFVREKELDPRLRAIEDSVTKQEKTLDRQNEILEQIRVELAKRR